MAAPVNGAVQLPSGATILAYEEQSGVTYVRYLICTAVFVQTAPPGPVTCTTYPEQKAQPARPAVPARVEYEPVFNWDAGAESAEQLGGDVAMRLTMSRVIGVIVGLCTAGDSELADPERILHGLYFHQGEKGQQQACALERGRRVSALRFYEAEDLWEVRRVGSTVEYLHNGQRFYRSQIPSHGTVAVGCAIFATGDSIE